jgi:arginine:pyruvate transaminase
MALSHRITHLLPGGSDGWEVFARAREMVAAGTNVTELTIGEHDIRTDPVVLEAMSRSASGGHTGYAAVPGTQDLRETVAARIQARTGTPTTFKNILITTGGQAALFASHIAVLDAGDTALYLDPYYATYPATIRSAGGVPVAIQTRAEDAFQPRAEDIGASANGAKSLLINSPNNPTGVVYTRETLEGIAEICKRNDLWLISDEVYDTQIWSGTHISPRSLPGMADRTLVVGSRSKSHAMTGSRVGWVCGPADAIEHMINLATNTTYGVPGFIQDAALFALNQGDALEEKIAAPFARRRILSQEVLAGQTVVQAGPCDGAMYVMLDIRATGLNGKEFANQLLDTHHIAVMPGESFGTSATGHVRVAMTIDDTTYAAALRTLIDFAHSLI